MFKRIEEALFQIKSTLLNSADVKKLLYHDTADALNRVEPTYQEVKDLIYTKPVIQIFEDSPEMQISSFVAIGLTQADLLTGSLNGAIEIGIASKREIWDLNNNKIRPLSLMSEIANLLNRTKLGPAGILELRVVNKIFFNNEIVGYSMLFDISDELGNNANEF